MLPHEPSKRDNEKDTRQKWPWHPDSWPRIQGLAYWEWIIPDAAVFYSREWQHMLQSDDEGVLGPSNAKWWPLVHDDDLVPFMDAARDIAEGRTEQYQTLLRILRGDGTWVWLLSRGSVTQKRRGKPFRVTGTINDVSSLRSDVKFQHGSLVEDQGNALLANSPDLIVRMDRQLSPLFNNPGIARYLTRSSNMEPASAKSPPLHIPRKQLLFLRQNVKQVFDTGLSAREVVSFPTEYGHDVTGEYSFWPEYDQEGNVVSVLTQFRDLTEQILAERRAKLNEMRLEALYRLTHMDNAPRGQVLDFVMESLIHLTGSEDGFLYFPSDPDDSGHVIWSRDLYDRIDRNNLPRAALPEDLFTFLSGGENTIRSRLANGNGLFPLQTFLGGALSVMRFIAVPVFDRGRLACLAAVFNKESLYYEADLQQLEAFISSSWLILRRHLFVQQLQLAKEAAEKANKELQLAKEIAERANKIKDSFLANVSHELRTPLNGILGMLQLLEEMPLLPQQREYVNTAGVSGRSLLRIVSDILDFSRMEAGKFELQNEKMNLGDIVRSSLKLFQQEAAQKGLGFSLAIDDAIPALVCGDDARMRQIVFNLVGNALKFTEKGSISVACSLLPEADPEEVLIRFSVSDTGIGIPREMQDAVFEAFTQLDSSSSKKYTGTGLGLTIVKRIISLMKGSVAVESEVGSGTAIHCTLRFKKVTALPAQLTMFRLVEDETPVPSMDILVAEDDPTSRFALRAFLQRAGHRVACVSNGKQALEALQLHPFHCLFTDILMPGMDGLELVRHIREKKFADFPPTGKTRAVLRAVIADFKNEPIQADPEIITVSVSAYAMAGDQDRFLSQGMDYYIAKPIIMKDLRAVLALIATRLASTRLAGTRLASDRP